MLPSSGSSSPFTPKRSRIKRKSNEEFNSVSRILTFDDSNSHSPFNKTVEYLPPSQQLLLPYENELNEHEQTTPIKTQQLCVEEKTKIVLSPSIKNRPNKFNIPEKDKMKKPSLSKRSGSKRSTPSKRCRSSDQVPITFYFKPTQNNQNSFDNVGFELNKHKDEENTFSKIENCISTVSIDSSKSDILSTTNSSQSLSLKYKTNKIINKNGIDEQVTPIKCENIISTQVPKKKHNAETNFAESSFTNEKITPLNNLGQVTPKKSKTINNTPSKSPKVLDYLGNKVIISGGDIYSKFIKFIVLKPELYLFGKCNIMLKIENLTDDELKIYGRLISRKHGWIRSNVADGLQKYKELKLCYNFDAVLTSLATNQLINTGIISLDIIFYISYQ